MADLVHGNRSPVTCHLRCGDACFQEVPNTTETSYFRDVAATALSRRSILGAAAVGAAGLALSSQPAAALVLSPVVSRKPGTPSAGSSSRSRWPAGPS